MIITTTAGSRSVWNAEIMVAHYDRPGVTFVAADDHDYATDLAAARVNATVGERLADLRWDVDILEREQRDETTADGDGSDESDDEGSAVRDARGRFADADVAADSEGD